MLERFTFAILITCFVTACAGPPDVAPRGELRWEADPDLLVKAELHTDSTMNMVNKRGMLCYRARLPWGDGRRGTENYRRSHNLADAPAWHGLLMAATAFELAVRTREPATDPAMLLAIEQRLDLLTGGILATYDVTGEPGLLANSVLPGYTGPEPFDWMTAGDPNKPWVRAVDTTGEWFRDGINKNHVNLTVFGCAVPLALERRGEITLAPATRDRLLDAMMPIARRLTAHDWQIVNRKGKRTQHGDLSPSVAGIPNGFHRTVVLNVLAAAAPYDEELAAEYERRLDDWDSGIERSMEVSGNWAEDRGHWNRKMNLGHSDPSALALAVVSFHLSESRPEARVAIEYGLRAWWTFMRHELNALYTIAMAAFALEGEAEAAEMEKIVAELRDFPNEKQLGREERDLTPGTLQHLRDRPVDTNYWKANPFERAEAPRPPRRNDMYAAGMDYLLAYWMGRYFEVVPVR